MQSTKGLHDSKDIRNKQKLEEILGNEKKMQTANGLCESKVPVVRLMQRYRVRKTGCLFHDYYNY